MSKGGGGGGTSAPMNREEQYCKNTDNCLLFILKSNREVEYIIINPWRGCVGAGTTLGVKEGVWLPVSAALRQKQVHLSLHHVFNPAF